MLKGLRRMNLDYRTFSAIDLVEDPFFRKWVYENKPETSAFWSSFIAQNPGMASTVDEAREVLIMMRKLREREGTPGMVDRAGNIKRKIDSAIHYPHLSTSGRTGMVSSASKRPFHVSTRVLAIAASVAITAVALVFLLSPRFAEQGSALKTETVVHTSPKGKRSMLTLPDGTKVWLNAESQLIYMDNFEHQHNREVFLVGEAFFDVTEDKSKPFVVNTSTIAIKVLGTRFNVQSYDKDRTVATTLVEGKVSVTMIDSHGNGSQEEVTSITANQRAVFIKESKKLVLENNVEAREYSDWRSGKLYFDDKPIMEVLAMIERWYNVDVHLDSTVSEYCTFSAKIDNKTLSEVLELFKASTGDQVTYDIKGKDVFISGKLCQ